LHTLITFATQWGSKYGGINSFNTDFLSAFGIAYNRSAQVICIVASATAEEIEQAAKVYVTLVPLPYKPLNNLFTQEQGQAGIEALNNKNISFDPKLTIWLGHDRITGAAACAAAKNAGGRSALIHHMSYDHYESYAENSQIAYEKKQEQATLFRDADIVLAVGPLLRDALKDILGSSKPVHTLIPGLAEIEPREAPKTFTAFLSGRLGDNAARIKQSYLGVAAFAQAHRDARKDGMPEGLCSQPKLVLRGIDFEAPAVQPLTQSQPDPETELKIFAEKYANGVINLYTLPFTQDRKTLYNDLSGANVALMPSWHEGFGLVAGEAIAAGVPLLLSKNSGVYHFLEEEFPDAGTGCVYVIDVRGSNNAPFFHAEDLQNSVSALKAIAHKPVEARRKASMLRGLLSEYTWPTCVEQTVKYFDWSLTKGSIPTSPSVHVEQALSDVAPSIANPVATHDSPLQIPQKFWKVGIGIADSQLLRAEEAIVPFDTARQPELDALNTWLDDPKWPQSVRLITGDGGSGKTRLALELCQQRLDTGWQAGFLDVVLDVKDMSASWQKLRNFKQPLLIVIDYAETRQLVLLALIKTMLQTSGDQPVRFLLLARDGGEWWDNLPSKDPQCESLLSGYATSGPFQLPALHATLEDRRQAYQQALHAYAKAFGVTPPDMIPELAGEHFDRPLYVQMAALLALHGEQPTSANGLTKALLNHERRYWSRLLANFGWSEPERHAQLLLALTTLCGGFETSRAAQFYWTKVNGNLKSADFSSLFQALVPLYPGKRGLQAVRPDLLGEALVAQALLCPENSGLLDAVLSSSATSSVRRQALTVIARMSVQRHDLDCVLIEAIIRHFAHCYQEIISVVIESPGRLSSLAEDAFARLPLNSKSQMAALLEPFFREESVQLAGISCCVMEYLVAKHQQRLSKKPKDIDCIVDYANTLDNYSICLRRTGRYDEALSCSRNAVKCFELLNPKDQQVYAYDYAGTLTNYAVELNEAGQNEEALKYAQQSMEIHYRLAQTKPDIYELDYAKSLINYAKH
jgi:glycosyltransferase involved in cell wall biosynthesis